MKISKQSSVLIVAAIMLFCTASQKEANSQNVDGVLDQGVRIIQFFSSSPKDTIKVYRGDALEMQFLKRLFPVCTVSISGASCKENDSIKYIRFTAVDTGNVQVYSKDNQLITTLKVIEYKTAGKAKIKNLSGKEAAEVLKDTSIFILDVRTPAEYQEGRIPGAVLIPIYELADRVNELDAYKNKPLFVYCRSGNRSIVAIQILTKQGFKNLLHLNRGIKSWINEDLPIEK
ncbi:MAG: rhodanese-like domain-containing protein [Fibrobacter sp.]|nr:rhodanese-like domain-containing protein [Fibrobacter sp.]